MHDHATTGKLELTWVKVQDAHGRPRMEARWSVVPVPAHTPATHAA